MFYFLYQLFYDPQSSFSFIRLFHYITSRSIFAALTSFLLAIAFGRYVINLLYKKGARELIRDYGVMSAQSKRGTPTMGGLLITGSSAAAVLLWCDLGSAFVLMCLAGMLFFAAVGFADDALKIRRQSSDRGLSRAAKYALQILFGAAFAWLFLWNATSPVSAELRTSLFVPFVKQPIADLGLLYAPFIVVVVMYCANAVNFADGMDGLAIVPSIFVVVVYGILAYILGNVVFSGYLLFDYIKGAQELTVFCAALLGASAGFLWFNAYPAELFMGDTGSMALGGAMGTMIVMLKQEALFLVVGGIFMAEIVSVVVQDWIGIKLLGRRLLFRAPIHHTFEHRGTAETKVVVRFWIISAMLALLSLMSLKVR